MALTQTYDGRMRNGDKWITFGTWTATGVTGGDLNTRLGICEQMLLTHTGTAVEGSVAVVNETFPCDGSAVTFVCTSGDTGVWFAIGRD